MYSAKIKRTLYLPSKPDTDTRLLLAWSTLYTGQSLDILQLWASSRGDEIYDNLINDFRHKCGLAELALIHVALLALLRLRCFHAKRTEPSGPDSFIRFRQLLEGFAGPSPQAQAVLEEMASGDPGILIQDPCSNPNSDHDCYSLLHSQTRTQ